MKDMYSIPSNLLKTERILPASQSSQAMKRRQWSTPQSLSSMVSWASLRTTQTVAAQF